MSGLRRKFPELANTPKTQSERQPPPGGQCLAVRSHPLIPFPKMLDQRRDALLLRLLKTPPQSRADLAEAVRPATGQATAQEGKRQPRKSA